MGEDVSWILLGALAALLLVAAVCDIRRREIDHWMVIAIALLAIPFWLSEGLAFWPDMVLQLGLAGLVFTIFAAMFAFGWMGGGDVKLLAALALWLPWQALLLMLVIMSFAGGILTLGMVVWSKLKRGPNPEIPYGVAIAFSGLWLIGERFLNQFG